MPLIFPQGSLGSWGRKDKKKSMTNKQTKKPVREPFREGQGTTSANILLRRGGVDRDKPAANNPGRAAMGLYQKQVGRAERERTSRKAAGAGGADYPSSTISQQHFNRKC